MKKAIFKLLLIIAVFVAFGTLQKLVFIAAYHRIIHLTSAKDVIDVLWHGMPMDLSIAGYLSIVPALLITTALWTKRRWPEVATSFWLATASFVLALITVLDLALYGYWGFRLDMTPLFYFTSSPASAMASVSAGQAIGGIAAIILATALLYAAFSLTEHKIRICRTGRAPIAATVVMLLLTASLVIPIRGGVTVSTMNLSRAYFSANPKLNHAAINPAFSLMYSATHQSDFDNEFRVMTDEEAAAALRQLAASALASDTTSTESHNNPCNNALLHDKRPDIWIIILESFSAHLMPSLGGENIAPGLDSIARNGVLFTNFYANSFRTDRAIPAIIGAFPAQPSMSLMKYVEKTEQLPSLSGELRKNGYETSYYYGGDINFTNMKAYLVNAGFENIVCDSDFSLSERTGKWGAHDHLVFSRALADVRTDKPSGRKPQLRVIQTSSSHEPFEVPYRNARFGNEPQKNAFAYTDSCLRAFVDSLGTLPDYERTLIVIVPDHLGAWPLDLPDAFARHHVPLVFAGGVLAARGQRIHTPGSQIDIAATILGQIGIDASRFEFSKDMLDSGAPHYAMFTESGMIGIATATDTVEYNCDAGVTEKLSGPNGPLMDKAAKAYLQHLYHTISEL